MNANARENQARLDELWNKNRDDFDKQYETEEKWDILKRDRDPDGIIMKTKIFSGGRHKKVNNMRMTRVLKDIYYIKFFRKSRMIRQ